MSKTRLLVIGERMISVQNVVRFAIPLAVVAGLGFSCGPTTADVIDILSPSPALAATATQYADGEYFAEGKGIGGKVPVTVTIDGGVIVNVEVGKNSETQGIGSKAIEQLPGAIIEANGTDGVDATSGATVTSKAIFTAVDEALEQASHTGKSGEPKSETTSSSKDVYYNNGEYFAEGKGIGGKVPVTVTIDGGVIVDVEVGKNSETQGIGSKAIEQLPGAIIEANGTDGVDATSGATVTSKAIFTAVDDCLEQAGTTNVKPETVMSNASLSVATENKDSAKSSSSSTDPLGVQKGNTLLFGDLAVELPDDYIGELKKNERGTQSVGVFSSEAMHVFCIVCYTTELAEYTTTGAEQAAILAVAETLGNLENLEAISDDSSEPLSKLGTNSAGTEVYLGSCKGTSKSIDKEVPALITATVDTDGNLLVVLCIITDSEGADEAVPISQSLLESALPDAFDSSTPSSSTSSSDSQTSNRSSYTPTRGEQNALSTAHDYLDTMAFSRSGLIDQLKYEGYTSSEAEYAVDNCGADWDYQAVLMAEEYLDAMPFSRSGLIEQLEYEGFSYSQASAAATAAGL